MKHLPPTPVKPPHDGYDFDPREDTKFVGSADTYYRYGIDPHAELENKMKHEEILRAKSERRALALEKAKKVLTDLANSVEDAELLEFPSYYDEGDNNSPLASAEDVQAINMLQSVHPEMFGSLPKKVVTSFHPNEAWIQTHTRARFNPTNPVVSAIDLEDIAHSLSLQCRFAGHCNEFYSVAQHSVLVSYLCGVQDALWGLMHDASEAYLVDVPRPLKRSGKFDKYLEFEKNMQDAICERFHLPKEEPISVKVADQIALATEVRDLMGGPRPDWTLEFDPFPAKIIPLSPKEAKELFLKRFAFLK